MGSKENPVNVDTMSAEVVKVLAQQKIDAARKKPFLEEDGSHTITAERSLWQQGV